MKQEQFNPLNALETALQGLREGTTGSDVFFAQLLESPVFLLLDRELGEPESPDPEALPLVLNNAQQAPVLALFTAAERAIPISLELPAYAHGAWVSLRWVLSIMRPGLGLVLNPGCRVGLELPVATVASLQAEAGEGGLAH